MNRSSAMIGLAMIGLAGALASCTSSAGGSVAPSRRLVVSAAASLTDAFGEVESAFEAANRDIDVVLNLGPSSGLREQILEGAPVDVFASASTSIMEDLVEANEVVGLPSIFARNRLEIAVPVGNPAHVTGLDDLADDDLLIGLCAVDVPCGGFARQALQRAGVTPVIDTNETDVRALLTKIDAGELDAGITYVTDVIAAGGVEGVVIPDELNVTVDYEIAALVGSSDVDAAGAFVDFVLAEESRRILASYGFASP